MGSEDCAIATKTAPIGRGTIAYSTVGTGPVLLLLHGLFATKEQWNTLVCALANAGYTAIAVDLPGYGKSTGYTLPDYRLDRQTQLLSEFTSRLGIAQLDVAGSSMGGAIATLYASHSSAACSTSARSTALTSAFCSNSKSPIG